jgi:hypothetical protein
MSRRLFGWVANLLLLAASGLVSIALLEGGTRLFLYPVDYLLPTIVADANLGHRVEGGSGGHDEWGFRNFQRPDEVDIVAIGDSMTYGIAARAQDSWPAALAGLTGKGVYNMALGGYGPLHYLHLFRERAMKLRPADVVVSVYFGSDFLDAVNLAYGNDKWVDYRLAQLTETSNERGFVIDQPEASADRGWFGQFRDYLARHSVLYRLTTSLPIFDSFRSVNLKSEDPGLFVFSMGDRSTILTPTQNRLLMNLDDPQILGAIEITKRALSEMANIAERENIRLHILLMPTKELVYSGLMESEQQIAAHPDTAPALEHEREIREDLIAFLDSRGFDIVDPLSELQRGVQSADIYPFNDGHPNAAGYRLIAEQVASHLRQ